MLYTILLVKLFFFLLLLYFLEYLSFIAAGFLFEFSTFTELSWVCVLTSNLLSLGEKKKRFIFTATVTFLCYLIHQTKENGINSDIYIQTNFAEQDQTSLHSIFHRLSIIPFLFLLFSFCFFYLWDDIIFASLNEHHTHHRFFYTKCLDFSIRNCSETWSP